MSSFIKYEFATFYYNIEYYNYDKPKSNTINLKIKIQYYYSIRVHVIVRKNQNIHHGWIGHVSLKLMMS